MWSFVLALVLSGLRSVLAFVLAHWAGVLAAVFHFILYTGAPSVVKLVASVASLLFAAIWGGIHSALVSIPAKSATPKPTPKP